MSSSLCIKLNVPLFNRVFLVNFQVIALICGLLVVILMVLGLASADWLMAAGWRQGLFMHCIDPEAPTPLPFDITAQPGCYAARPAPYIKAAAGLCVATLAADILPVRRSRNGIGVDVHINSTSDISCLLRAELNLGNRSVWEFDGRTGWDGAPPYFSLAPWSSCYATRRAKSSTSSNGKVVHGACKAASKRGRPTQVVQGEGLPRP
ncbi:hypothetical protein ACJJTC_001725 [Scirpophaga incertulas]